MYTHMFTHMNRYKLLGRNTTSITTEVNGVKRQVTVIAVNKFDSDRKRMSVIIKEDNGTIRLLCKVSAHSILYKRILYSILYYTILL
jgi:magnesium-transporting ATPase (P-type)